MVDDSRSARAFLTRELERHELAGLAKDIGSAAVMLSFILLGVVWLLVLTGR